MNLMQYIPKSAIKPTYRAALVLKKHAPHILFGAGVAGAATSTVMACKATLKLSDELPKMKQELENVREDTKDLEEVEQKKAVAMVYGANTAKVVKAYAPAFIVGSASIACLTGSHVTLTRRNAALTAAYATLSQAYDNYRERVRDDHGNEQELHTYHAVENKGTKTKPKLHSDPNKWSAYARFFDEASTEFQPNGEMNKLFIQCQQNYANNILQSRGHIFLNEVYDMLGLERSQAGSVVGWVIGPLGDNYVDFGIMEAINSRAYNGDEPRFLLDFNVDGVIYDKIGM